MYGPRLCSCNAALKRLTPSRTGSRTQHNSEQTLCRSERSSRPFHLAPNRWLCQAALEDGSATLEGTTFADPTAQDNLLVASSVESPVQLSAAADQSAARSAAKQALMLAVSGLRRGAAAGLEDRGQVEEAQVALEAFGGEELEWDLLPGTWELVYTTANDVVPILGADTVLSLPFLGPVVEVGLVGQRFIADKPGFGTVENIVQLGIKPWLQPRDGITTVVKARYEQRGPHTLRLAFERAQVGDIRLSPLTQALLAPAIFPRLQLQQSLLLAIQEFEFQIQFRTAQEAAQGKGAGGGYQLTYLDEDVLIGRAENSGGSFIFGRKE